MTLHLLKMAVGVADIQHLRRLQDARRHVRDGREVVPGWTRRMPTRREEIVAGGSIFWIIKGQIRVRQRVLDLVTETDDEGAAFCRMILDPELVPTEPVPHRPMQGWRYFRPEAAPPDLGEGDLEMPDAMRAELRALGLV